MLLDRFETIESGHILALSVALLIVAVDLSDRSTVIARFVRLPKGGS